MLKRLENRAEVIVAGHRGMKAFYPENTLLSFQKALDLKVDMLEIDLNLTRDKQVVVIHDNTLDRTTDGAGFVHDFTLDEIKKLDAGKWFAAEFAGDLPGVLSIHQRMSRRRLRQLQGIVAVLRQVADQRQTVGRWLHEDIDEREALRQGLVAAHANDAAHHGHGHVRPARLQRTQALQLVVGLIL